MEYTKAHQKTYVKHRDIFCSLKTFACYNSLQASMHAACSMPSSAVPRQRTPSNKRFMQNNYKQSCETGIHENMWSLLRVGVWCMESLLQVTCNKKHFAPVTHFCFTRVKQIMVCVQVWQACNRVTWTMPGKLCFACNRTTLPSLQARSLCLCGMVRHYL